MAPAAVLERMLTVESEPRRARKDTDNTEKDIREARPREGEAPEIVGNYRGLTLCSCKLINPTPALPVNGEGAEGYEPVT